MKIRLNFVALPPNCFMNTLVNKVVIRVITVSYIRHTLKIFYFGQILYMQLHGQIIVGFLCAKSKQIYLIIWVCPFVFLKILLLLFIADGKLHSFDSSSLIELNLSLKMRLMMITVDLSF